MPAAPGDARAAPDAPPPGTPPGGDAEASPRLTVIEHLEALRKVLIVSILAWTVGSIVAFGFHSWIFDRLVDPGREYFPGGTVIVLKPTGAFGLVIKVTVFGGFVIALPVILAAFWWFIRPGLYKKEKRAVLPLTVSSLVLFASGALLAYHLLPIALKFLVGVAGPSVRYLPAADDYINFIALMMLAFGLTFEMPVALVVLSMVGIVTAKKLSEVRRYAIVGIILAALVITPGTDPISPFLLAIPLLVLYELSIVVIRLIHRRR